MPLYLSNSDIATYKKCRQMWDYSSVNRQSLKHNKSPALYLQVGSAIHIGIETAARAGLGLSTPGWRNATIDYMQQERLGLIEAHKAEHGFAPFDMELLNFDEQSQFVLDLLEQYFNEYDISDPLGDQGLTYLAVEVPFTIPMDIRDENGRPVQVFYVGTFDGLAEDEQGNIWVVENKTYSATPDVEDLQYHSQCNGYAVAFEMLTGMHLSGTLYNGLAKQLIKKPKTLDSGLVSTDKRQLVTLQSYLDGLHEAGQDPFDPRYFEILRVLQERERLGDHRFFHREKIYFNEYQVASWHEDLELVAEEIVRNPRIYRTVPYNGCGPRGQGCWFRDLCHTQYSGGDVQEVMDKRYTVGTYGTMKEVDGATPHMVESSDELKEFLRGLR